MSKLTYIILTADNKYHVGTEEHLSDVFKVLNTMNPVHSYVLEGDVEHLVNNIGAKKVYNICKILKYGF